MNLLDMIEPVLLAKNGNADVMGKRRLIAATALEHDLDFVTRNADDLKQVPGLKWSNPFDQAPTT